MPPYPEDRSTSDWLVPATRGALGAVPIVGGLLGEVVGFAWAPALQRRQTEWFRKLGERVQELSETIDDLEERLKREDVLTIAVNAARAATATHEETKRAAFRAAVINTALRIEPDEEMRLMFVRLLDRLSSTHVQLLMLFADPRGFFESRDRVPPEYSVTSSLSSLIKNAFPEWDPDLSARVAANLDQEGLAQTSGLNTMMSASGAFQRRITPLGIRFLRFITDAN
jgi:hypothetical protein